MKYELSDDDKKIMVRDMQTNRTLKHLKNMSFYKFSVGDVLIREDKYTDDLNMKMADCKLPYKYVYVFENELGVGYIRRLSINGRKFVEAPICVVEFDPEQTRFALDPEYADHILLSPDDASFDAKSRYDEIKKRREQIHRKNKKLRIQIATVDEAFEFMKKLKPGDQFWHGSSIGAINKEPCTVFQTHLDTVNKDQSYINYTHKPGSYPYRLTAYSFIHGSVFLTRPLFLDEAI